MYGLIIRKLPKIRLVHLLTDPSNYREIASIASLQPLSAHMEYTQVVNPRFTGVVPRENAAHPEHISDDPEFGLNRVNRKYIGPGTWGCFQAHKSAIINSYDANLDYLLVCECDCVINVKLSRFLTILAQLGASMSARDMWSVFIGGHGAPNGSKIDEFYFSEQSVDAHCVLYPMATLPNVIRLLETEKWAPFDLWLGFMLKRRLAVTVGNFASQVAGKSLVDGTFKGKELGRVVLGDK